MPRLGDNAFRVIAADGTLESDPVEVSATLQSGRPGAWMIVVDDDRGLAWPVDAREAPRIWSSVVETHKPPGNPYGYHLHWGNSGRQTTIVFRYIPTEDGAIARALGSLLGSGAAVYLKAPPGYDWDVLRAKLVSLGPEAPAESGFVDLTTVWDETAPEVPG
jgi:hypothetical protein